MAQGKALSGRGRVAAVLGLAALPGLASAASLNGAELSLAWGIPFAGILSHRMIDRRIAEYAEIPNKA